VCKIKKDTAKYNSKAEEGSFSFSLNELVHDRLWPNLDFLMDARQSSDLM
jgi:hypothetical protein